MHASMGLHVFVCSPQQLHSATKMPTLLMSWCPEHTPAWLHQGRPTVCAKLLVNSEAGCAAVSRLLQGSSEWGRGRIAQVCNAAALPLGSSDPLQVSNLYLSLLTP